MRHRQSIAFPPKKDRRHMVVQFERRAVIRRAIPIICTDLRYGAPLFRLEAKCTLLKANPLNKAINTLSCLLFKNPGKVIFGKMTMA